MDNLLIITGPPRSGTTLQAKIASHTGYHLGFRLNNKLENNTIIRCTEHILSKQGATWDRPSEASGEVNIDPVVNFLKNSALLNYELPVAIKEPRYLFVEDVFERIWEELGVEPKMLYTDRHPMDIAVSLWRRETNKPQKLIGMQTKEHRELSSRGFGPYPMKSTRLMKLDYALDYAKYCRSLLEGKENIVQYEDFVRSKDLQPEVSERSASVVSNLRLHIDEEPAFRFKEDESLLEFWNMNSDDYSY